MGLPYSLSSLFQHTAARRRLAAHTGATTVADSVSTHSRPKAAGLVTDVMENLIDVSTHSRPKAAGKPDLSPQIKDFCFNTQPPEGGWDNLSKLKYAPSMFQHTAARRRLARRVGRDPLFILVSTHSRPKAAGGNNCEYNNSGNVSTHSRPKAAGYRRRVGRLRIMFQHTAARRRLVRKQQIKKGKCYVSTHSRPKAAG